MLPSMPLRNRTPLFSYLSLSLSPEYSRGEPAQAAQLSFFLFPILILSDKRGVFVHAEQFLHIFQQVIDIEWFIDYMNPLRNQVALLFAHHRERGSANNHRDGGS